MDKPSLKEASVLTNPSLWKICQRKACSLVGACMTTWSQKISPLKISSSVAHCVKASEVQEPSMRIILKSREKQNRATKKHLNAKPSRSTDIVRKKKALLESTGSRVSQRCWQVFFRSWKWKKSVEDMKPVVVIKVKLFQTNSNRKRSNERVWETNKRINEAERKDCLRLLSWFDFWKTCSYLILFLFYCLLSLFVSSFRLDTRKLAFYFTILFYHATSLLKCILNFYVLVLINESKSTLLQIGFKHILVLQNGNKSFCSLFFYLKVGSLYFVIF